MSNSTDQDSSKCKSNHIIHMSVVVVLLCVFHRHLDKGSQTTLEHKVSSNKTLDF